MNRCFPKGYKVIGLHSGIKKQINLLDLGILISQNPQTNAAGCFTRNVFKAAPVKYSISKITENRGRNIRAVIVNSGCANAVTGHQGDTDTQTMAHLLDTHLNQNSASLVLSTGVIGQLLPIEKIRKGFKEGINKLGDTEEHWQSLSKAFMTTDTFPKLLTHKFKISENGEELRMVGIDKGAGMIHPSMGPPHATLLGLIATDANIEPESLQKALTCAVNKSFNRISVDGDMSTNDTILILANGESKNTPISHINTPKSYAIFEQELTKFAVDLAKLVVRDGEGATKFVEVIVKGAHSEEDATIVASNVATSTLVKCALNGEDSNWGRILCAVGYSKVTHPIQTHLVSVSISSQDLQLQLLTNGEPEPNIDEVKAKSILKNKDITITIDLGRVKDAHQSYFYTCDLSKEYIAINADYRS
ncbi:hypothetical protein MJO28_013635 [Puccinia striiformis f. sp. tritici]|uniref:Uncharacterized protein n=1 Tax=Puccinia striiformis f. sp. tritici TaxID=168172 RepID=A0ACC0DX01_9BASI|nr:hypothetical protein Pst134EB_026429 [Puccinia striiformis f. sp. tritici]KAI7939983.1 hypothetical protein MJO28_013635 [Puccinia striiformis f. sp. tritici]KAI7941402.1 hypothetical protein MJO29_013476 [Puccinia striiformis f. sp. tritici]